MRANIYFVADGKRKNGYKYPKVFRCCQQRVRWTGRDARVQPFNSSTRLEILSLKDYPHDGPSPLAGTRVGSSCDRLSRRNCRETESFQNVLHFSCSTQISAPADVVPQPRWQLSSSGASFSSGTSSQSPRCSLGHLRIFSFKLDPSPILSIDST